MINVRLKPLVEGRKVYELRAGQAYMVVCGIPASAISANSADAIVVGVSADIWLGAPQAQQVHGVSLSGLIWHSGDLTARFVPIDISVEEI